MNRGTIQEHIKLYTNNKVISKKQIQDRASELDMSQSEYLLHCVSLELNKPSN